MKKLIVRDAESNIIAQTQGSEEELAIWLEGDKFKYPEGYIVEYIDITAQVLQERINDEARNFLSSTDWKILRHLDQKSIGIATSLSDEKFIELLEKRQLARNQVISI